MLGATIGGIVIDHFGWNWGWVIEFVAVYSMIMSAVILMFL